MSLNGDPGANDCLLRRHARHTPLSNAARAALTHVVGVGLCYLCYGDAHIFAVSGGRLGEERKKEQGRTSH